MTALNKGNVAPREHHACMQLKFLPIFTKKGFSQSLCCTKEKALEASQYVNEAMTMLSSTFV